MHDSHVLKTCSLDAYACIRCPRKWELAAEQARLVPPANLKSKAHQSVHTITPEASVFDAIKLMAEKRFGALLVTEAEEVAGIIMERDYARKIVLMSRSSKQTLVREIDVCGDVRATWRALS